MFSMWRSSLEGITLDIFSKTRRRVVEHWRVCKLEVFVGGHHVGYMLQGAPSRGGTLEVFVGRHHVGGHHV